MKIVALRAVGVGRLMRQAIWANDLAMYHHVSRRVSAGRDAAAQLITRARGTLHACPSIGGNSFLARVPSAAVDSGFASALKRAFMAEARPMSPGVGVGHDLRSAVEACERDVDASSRPEIGSLGRPAAISGLQASSQVVSVDGNDIGRGMRRAIASNRMSAVDAYSSRVSRGMDGAIALVRGVGGSIHGAGGDNFCGVVRRDAVERQRIKQRFFSDTAGLTAAVGIGSDLRSSYINLVFDKRLYLALVWDEALERSFEADFRLL